MRSLSGSVVGDLQLKFPGSSVPAQFGEWFCAMVDSKISRTARQIVDSQHSLSLFLVASSFPINVKHFEINSKFIKVALHMNSGENPFTHKNMFYVNLLRRNFRGKKKKKEQNYFVSKLL